MDNRRHKIPHIHVHCQGAESVFAIPTGKLLEGQIASSKKRLLQAWIEIHKDELMADWKLAVNGIKPFKIEPLK